MLYFNLSFSTTRSDINKTQRSHEYGNSSLEVFELATERVKNQNDVGEIIVLDMFNNIGRAGTGDALDVDEGEPPSSDILSEEQIYDQLSQETTVGGFSLNPAY